jgi:hypothetical protein
MIKRKLISSKNSKLLGIKKSRENTLLKNWPPSWMRFPENEAHKTEGLFLAAIINNLEISFSLPVTYNPQTIGLIQEAIKLNSFVLLLKARNLPITEETLAKVSKFSPKVLRQILKNIEGLVPSAKTLGKPREIKGLIAALAYNLKKDKNSIDLDVVFKYTGITVSELKKQIAEITSDEINEHLSPSKDLVVDIFKILGRPTDIAPTQAQIGKELGVDKSSISKLKTDLVLAISENERIIRHWPPAWLPPINQSENHSQLDHFHDIMTHISTVFSYPIDDDPSIFNFVWNVTKINLLIMEAKQNNMLISQVDLAKKTKLNKSTISKMLKEFVKFPSSREKLIIGR